jgi:DNA primase
MAIHDVAARFFECQVRGSWVPGYLTRRGFDRGAQLRWQVGYAPAGRDALATHLRAVGYQDGAILAAGLARRSTRGSLTDTFRDRAVLPIRSQGGTIVAFVGRAPERAAPAVPKYLNSPATALYGKGDVLFGLWESRSALSAGATPVLVEGPFDVIAIAEAGQGRYAPVAPCGTALTARQVLALDNACALRETDVLVAFDADHAGRRAAVAAYSLISPLARRVLAVTLPADQDPAQVLREDGPGRLARVLAGQRRPLADLVVDAEICEWARWLSFAEGRIGALRSAATVVAAMPPAEVGRQVSRLASRLDLDYETVTMAVLDALTDPRTARGRRP